MGEISLTLRGLGVWMNRKSHWEILFPAAEQRQRVIGSSSKVTLPRHDPILRILDDQGDVTRVFDLRDRILDLRELADHDNTAFPRHPNMIGMEMTSDAPARSVTAISKDTKVTGGVKLPSGFLKEMQVAKNVKYRGKTKDLACQMSWTATAKAGRLQLLLREDDSVVDSIEVPDTGIKLAIECLSVADALDPVSKKEPRLRDDDFAALYLLGYANHTTQTDVPELPPPPPPPPVPVPGMKVDPEHLCSSVNGEPDPPE